MDKKLLTYLESYLTDNRKTLFNKVLENRTRHFSVVLEDTYQTHNTSAVVRSCDIFGIQDIYTIERKYISKVSKHVTKGSDKWLTFHREISEENSTAKCFEKLRDKDYQIIGTTPHSNSCLLSEFDITKKTAFVFGTEKKGISDYVKNNADGFLKVPMYGFTESLNISVAVAIILQNVTTRLRETDISWKLTSKEHHELYEKWVLKSIKNVDSIIKYYNENIYNKE